jgi:hypothetical protein
MFYGGGGGGRGRRNMYYLTGLPGWMRFGFSPGWVGRSPTGMGPGATYLMTGQWPTPQAQAYWDAMQAGQAPFPAYGMGAAGMGIPGPAYGAGMVPPWGAPTMTREQELSMLRNQADWLKSQLDQISNRISELEKEQ